MTQSNFFINRVYKNSAIIIIILMILSFLLTRDLVNSLIVLFAAITGVFGFFMSIKTLDRFLQKKKGKTLFILVFFLKLIIIAVGFYPVSKISETAALFYIAGISVIVISIMLEGLLELFTNRKKINEG